MPEFYDAVCAAEPMAAAVGYRRTTNRWRRYHEAERWPEGFIAVRHLPDGRALAVVPLTYGRARLCLGPGDLETYVKAW